MKKGTEIISSMLLTAMILTAVTITYKAAMPKIKEAQSITYLTQGKDILNSLSSTMYVLSLESSGARKIVNLDVPVDSIYISSKSNSIVYKLRSYANIVGWGAMSKEGNLIITSGQSVSAYESGNEYIMKNGNVLISFKKLGNSTNYENINVNDVINYVEINGVKYHPKISVDIDHNNESSIGYGYTEFSKEGDFLNSDDFLVHIKDSSRPYNYTVVYTLGTNWDFITVNVRDIKDN